MRTHVRYRFCFSNYDFVEGSYPERIIHTEILLFMLSAEVILKSAAFLVPEKYSFLNVVLTYAFTL